jgi:hypothetical protein
VARGKRDIRLPRRQREESMPELNSVVAVYATHDEAEAAVKQLEQDGIDMRTLSIVGKSPGTSSTPRAALA